MTIQDLKNQYLIFKVQVKSVFNSFMFQLLFNRYMIASVLLAIYFNFFSFQLNLVMVTY